MNRRVWMIVIVLALGVPHFLLARLNGNRDFQIWNHYSIETSLPNGWSFDTMFLFRYGDGGGRLYYHALQGVLLYRPTDWLALGPGYRQAWRKIEGRRIEERRVWVTACEPLFDLVLRAKFHDFVVTNRNRVQGRLEMSRHLPHDWVYRTRLHVRREILKSRLTIAPFVSDEIFLRRGERLTENRLEVGLWVESPSHLTVQVLYMFRDLRSRGRQNVLGLYLSLDA